MYRQSEKNLLSSNISSTCPRTMLNFGPLAAEIVSLVSGTPGNFKGFRVLAALLHGTLVVGVSQTLRRWTQGATYIRKGGHHVGHWPTFLVVYSILVYSVFVWLCGYVEFCSQFSAGVYSSILLVMLSERSWWEATFDRTRQKRNGLVKAKFHYASYSSELAPNMFGASSELVRRWNLA